jgi:hypothetical protein
MTSSVTLTNKLRNAKKLHYEEYVTNPELNNPRTRNAMVNCIDFKVTSCDKVTDKRPHIIVIATKARGSTDGHWTALSVTRTSITFFDPIGDMPALPVKHFIAEIATRLGKKLGKNIAVWINRRQFQRYNTQTCGQWVMKFAKGELPHAKASSRASTRSPCALKGAAGIECKKVPKSMARGCVSGRRL